ncbi:hypothetical protein Hanom_Chr15g01410631 [Helianthus anomalus]
MTMIIEEVTKILYRIKNCCWFTLCGRDSVRIDSVRFDSVRFGSSTTSPHSSVVRPRVRHAKHGEPRTNSR